MDRNRWKRVQEIFLEIVDLPTSEWPSALDAACGDDADLRTQVESLLAADADATDVLDADLDDLVDLLTSAGAGPGGPAPERAGPYRIEEEIGRGGMGVVYRARRDDDQYTREVALKVVDVRGRSAEDLARRFRRERQILAGLEHPNIARLYGAGVTDEGQPWLAMELVRGEPIHRYCDRRALSVDERLRLFEQVVAGVEYAHRNLVVHRDLKPSNILVTDAGEVKLLDFGIAKLLAEEPRGDGDDPLTREDQRVLTPEYASPEQLDGRPLTTASDVYSLGVLLHQLLTGRRPTVDATTRDTLEAPSAAASSPAPSSRSTEQEPDEVARARGTTPARLARALRGELDTLVLAALRVEPERRYPSAAALLDDLVRYRTGRPLTARPPSTAYRMGKFVGRNRLAVGAAAAAVVALVVGLGVALQQSRVARAERDVARSVSTFLEDLFTATNAFEVTGARQDTLRIGAFLTRAAERLDTALADQPEVKARMQRVLGTAHERVGLYDQAEALLDASLEAHRSMAGDRHPEVRLALTSLGRAARGAGDPPRAVTRFREALALTEAAEGPESRATANAQLALAGALLDLNELAEAEELIQSAVSVRAGALGEQSAEMAGQLELLASLQYRQGRIDPAIATIRSARDMNTAVLGPDHPQTAVTAQNLGLILFNAGRPAEAEEPLRDALRALRGALGTDHPNVAATMKNLANVTAALGRWDEADSLFRASLDLTRRVAPDSRDLAIASHDYGLALMNHGQVDGAVPLLDEALRLERNLTGPRSPSVGIVGSTAAEARRMAGDAAGAEAMFRTSLDILQSVFPPDHPRVLRARGGLGLALLDAGDHEESLAVLTATYEAAGGVEDGGRARRTAAANLARWHDAAGDGEDAARFRAEAEGPGEGAGSEGEGGP